ncbi:MAG TPA: D-alanyl-D-alanine carboxypeptidase/D-alanyl-D-alanine-endopeptidase [Rhodanobacteraceae bacterium]
MKRTPPLPHRRHLSPRWLAPCLLLIIGVSGCAGAPPAPVTSAAPATATPDPTRHPAPTATSPARAPATSITPAQRLAARINAFISQPRFASAQWGISVVSLADGDTLYAHNADKLGIPASNTKLYTTALALSTMGADARIHTTLYATARPRRGTLDGDLILYGRGDPTLGAGSDQHTPNAWSDHLAAALAARGIKRVHGSIVADATWFDGPPIAPGWEARDLQSWYVPPASALTVNGNMFYLSVGPHDGLCCDVNTSPESSGANIVNLAQTDPSASWSDLGIYRPPGSTQLYVYGGMQPRAKTRHFVLSSPDPAHMAGELLLDALARYGISVSGGVRSLHWPQTDAAIGAPGTRTIASVVSPPLGKIVHHTLKHSDNLYAELLMLAAGKRLSERGNCPDRTRAPATTLAWARCGMRQMLARIGIDKHHALIEEGSGLSRKDLVTPRATTRLLAWATHQPFASVYRDALPLAGVDGTLKHRMRNTLANDNVQAKTGTLRYSYTLSGYVTDAAGQPLVFSLMLEDYARPTDAQDRRAGPSPQHDLDAVAEMLANFGRMPTTPAR